MILLLVSCRPCPTFAEMEVVDVSGAGTAAELDLIEQIVAEFASSTGRVGVCVPEIQLVAEADDPRLSELNGFYLEPHEAISIQAGLHDLERVTRHELCHALDGLETLHADRGELFPPDSVVETDIYDTEDARTGEAFARACEEGGAGVGVERPILAACGFDPETAAADFLLDTIYVESEPAGSVALPIDRYAVGQGIPEGHLAGARALLDTDQLVVDLTLDDAGAYAAPPAIARYGIARAAQTGSVTLTGAQGGDWAILTGDGEVVAVEIGEATNAWRVDFDAGTATSLAGFPAGGSGVVTSGDAWVSNDDGLTRYALADGVVETIAWPTDRTVSVAGWAASPDALYGATVRDGLLVRRGNAWEVQAGPGSLPLFGTTLSGDRWVVTTIRVGTYDFYRSSISSLLLYDLEDERWVVPEAPCGIDGSFDPEAFANGDAAWIRDAGGDPFGAYEAVYYAHVRPEESR